MPVRTRAGSSPLREKEAPELRVTSPSKRSSDDRLRRGSHDAVEAVKQRERRDTTTSSELSSENELDASVFRRRQINFSRHNIGYGINEDRTEYDEQDEHERLQNVMEVRGEESDHVSEGSSLSSEFAETADSESLLSVNDDGLGPSSSLADLMPAALVVNPPSPRRTRNQAPNTLQALPPPRPISTIQPGSALSQAIRAQKAKPKNPVEFFAPLDGKGDKEHFAIKIYTPFSENPSEPFEMTLLRIAKDGDSGGSAHVTVADAIGYSLWRYFDEGLKPQIPRENSDVNRWTLRIVDDGEVEYDFPALNRVSNMGDFTSNNNRPVRGRSKRTFDEFALVEATEAQYQENQRLTPKYTRMFEDLTKSTSESLTIPETQGAEESAIVDGSPINTTINKPFAFNTRKGSASLDKPAIAAVYSTPRMGPPKMLKIHFTSLEAQSQNSMIEVSTDTYIAEVLDTVCKRWNLDKTQHILRVSGTNTVAPLDRTVEAIGARTDLDLIRRRFGHDGSLGIAGSPSSSSPNAPLLLVNATPPLGKKSKKINTAAGGGGLGGVHPLSQNQELWDETGAYKKYAVVRKQPMSFAPSHSRTLLMDGEYLHILPGETNKTLFDTTNAKSTTVPFSMIIGCKVSRRHAKTFRVIVFKEREKKRYDFEASSANDATEIVAAIRKGMEPFIATQAEAAKKLKGG